MICDTVLVNIVTADAPLLKHQGMIIHNTDLILVFRKFHEENLNTWKNTQFKGLTHCGLVTPYGDMALGQHWLR